MTRVLSGESEDAVTQSKKATGLCVQGSHCAWPRSSEMPDEEGVICEENHGSFSCLTPLLAEVSSSSAFMTGLQERVHLICLISISKFGICI